MLFSSIETLLQKRNTLLDNFFYDTDSLTTEEQQRLTEEVTPEGAIIIVQPKKANQAHTVYETAKDFANSEHYQVSRFVIAGVGSSDLGGAALARNVADFFNAPVGAIVAGYGMKDFMSEALGGWFSLGAANQQSYIQEIETGEDGTPFISGNPDSTTMLSLLNNEKINIELLLGHSKGCLSLSNALFGFIDFASDKTISSRINNIQIVTTGAVINLPDEFNHVYQFLGDYDWFGGLNSRIGLDFNKIAGAWHHTNTRLPLSMSIQGLLNKLTPINEVTT